MSFTGIVAFENPEGTYDVHNSNNGGDRYMLREVLNEYLDGETNKTADDISRMEAFCDQALDMAAMSELTGESVQMNAAEVINSTPVATDVEKQHILSEVETYDAEAFFVVPYRGESVETYVPVTPDPMPLFHIAETAELNMYQNQDRKHPGMFMKEISEESVDPDFVLSGSDLHPSNISELPYWATQIIEQSHRYIYNKMIYIEEMDPNEVVNDTDIDEEIGQNAGVSLTLGPAVTHVKLINELDHSRTHPAIPIKVTFDQDDNPVYPMRNSLEMMGSMPVAFGSEVRMEVFNEYYNDYLDRTNSVEELRSEMEIEATKRIVDDYSKSTAVEYLPDRLKQAI